MLFVSNRLSLSFCPGKKRREEAEAEESPSLSPVTHLDLDFDPLSALKCVNDHEDLVTVAGAQQWKEARSDRHLSAHMTSPLPLPRELFQSNMLSSTFRDFSFSVLHFLGIQFRFSKLPSPPLQSADVT